MDSIGLNVRNELPPPKRVDSTPVPKGEKSGYNRESNYYRPYSRLLHRLFPGEEDFLIEPQFNLKDDSQERGFRHNIRC